MTILFLIYSSGFSATYLIIGYNNNKGMLMVVELKQHNYQHE